MLSETVCSLYFSVSGTHLLSIRVNKSQTCCLLITLKMSQQSPASKMFQMFVRKSKSKAQTHLDTPAPKCVHRLMNAETHKSLFTHN